MSPGDSSAQERYAISHDEPISTAFILAHSAGVVHEIDGREHFKSSAAGHPRAANEMQTQTCRPVTEPTQDPAGTNIQNTAHLYVLIPTFSVDNDQDPEDAMACPGRPRPGELCGTTLGKPANLAIRRRARSLENEGESRHHGTMPRPRPCSARYLYHACFLGRPVGNAGRDREDPWSSDSANLCAGPKSQPHHR